MEILREPMQYALIDNGLRVQCDRFGYGLGSMDFGWSK